MRLWQRRHHPQIFTSSAPATTSPQVTFPVNAVVVGVFTSCY